MTLDSKSFVLAQEVDTPSLLLDLDIFESNMLALLKICQSHGVSLQPHAKTHRTPEIGRLQQDLGADGLCVAKVGEAEGFAEVGVRKITVAYPVLGKSKIERALNLARRVDLTLGVDSVIGAREIGEVFAAEGMTCKLLLIIDTGPQRDGVLPSVAPDVATEISAIPGVRLDGIMTHEGTVYASANPQELEQASQAVATLMVETAQSIRAKGVDLPRVSMGASASARFVAKVPGVTQIRPGIFAFNDLGQVALGNATLDQVAVRVLTTVVSRPSPTSAVIDGGSKTFSQDLLPAAAHRSEYPGHGLIIGKPGWVIERLSEEHGMVRFMGTGNPPNLDIGEKVQVIPNHICTVFSSLNECVVLRSGKVQAFWRTFAPGASR